MLSGICLCYFPVFYLFSDFFLLIFVCYYLLFVYALDIAGLMERSEEKNHKKGTDKALTYLEQRRGGRFGEEETSGMKRHFSL